jgi:hypothetical protein
MAAKWHTLNGTDCFNDDMALEIRRDKKRVIVKTSDDERFCCKYDDLVELVKNLAPKQKKDKGEVVQPVSEGIALPTDGVT